MESDAVKDTSSDLAPALATTAPGEEEDRADVTAVADSVATADKSEPQPDTEGTVDAAKTEQDKADAQAEDSDLLSGEEDEDGDEAAEAERARESTSAPAVDTNTEHSESSKRLSVASSSSPKKGKVRGWLKNRLSRSKSSVDKEENSEKRKSFFGGSLRKKSAANESSNSADNRPSSIRDIALAGKDEEEAKGEETAAESAAEAGDKKEEEQEVSDSRGVSPVTTPGAEEFKDARQTTSLEAPVATEEPVGRLSSSGSRFKEEIQ